MSYNEKHPLALTRSAAELRKNPTSALDDPFMRWTSHIEDDVTFPRYWVLRRQMWKIAAFVVLCVGIVGFLTKLLPTKYASTATVDVDMRAPVGVIGQDSIPGMSSTEMEGFIATQAKLIQGDAVLRPIVERFKLHEDLADNEARARSKVGHTAPIVLRSLDVTRAPNTSLLLISYRHGDPEKAAAVANAVAQRYIDYSYQTRFEASAQMSAYLVKQLQELKAKMESSAAALAPFERELNVIDPEQKTGILSARLLQLNNELTTVQVERVQREALMSAVAGGSLEAAQSAPQADQLRSLSTKIDESRERLAVVKSQYGTNHPEHKKAAAQVEELDRQRQAVRGNIVQRIRSELEQTLRREEMINAALTHSKRDFDALNAKSFGYKALKQEAEADRALYQELVRKTKEAGINSSFRNMSLRFAEVARPSLQPASPVLWLNLALALLVSTLLGVGVAILADMSDRTLRDPNQILKLVKARVLTALPAVPEWRKKPNVSANQVDLALSANKPTLVSAAYTEGIRILGSSLQPPMFGEPGLSLLMTSAVPGEGKTTTAIHLAISRSQQRRRTLLIDCDLRNPSIHRVLEIPNAKGMASVVDGEVGWRDAILKIVAYPHLSIIPAGLASSEAPDQVSRVLAGILCEARKVFDVIIVDSPPVLGFAEALEIGALVEYVVVVALAGRTESEATAQAVERLRYARANVVGVALNQVADDLSKRYHYYSHDDYYGSNLDLQRVSGA